MLSLRNLYTSSQNMKINMYYYCIFDHLLPMYKWINITNTIAPLTAYIGIPKLQQFLKFSIKSVANKNKYLYF